AGITPGAACAPVYRLFAAARGRRRDCQSDSHGYGERRCAGAAAGAGPKQPHALSAGGDTAPRGMVRAAADGRAAIARQALDGDQVSIAVRGCRISGALSQQPAVATSTESPKSDIRHPKSFLKGIRQTKHARLIEVIGENLHPHRQTL